MLTVDQVFLELFVMTLPPNQRQWVVNLERAWNHGGLSQRQREVLMSIYNRHNPVLDGSVMLRTGMSATHIAQSV